MAGSRRANDVERLLGIILGAIQPSMTTIEKARHLVEGTAAVCDLVLEWAPDELQMCDVRFAESTGALCDIKTTAWFDEDVRAHLATKRRLEHIELPNGCTLSLPAGVEASTVAAITAMWKEAAWWDFDDESDGSPPLPGAGSWNQETRLHVVLRDAYEEILHLAKRPFEYGSAFTLAAHRYDRGGRRLPPQHVTEKHAVDYRLGFLLPRSKWIKELDRHGEDARSLLRSVETPLGYSDSARALRQGAWRSVSHTHVSSGVASLVGNVHRHGDLNFSNFARDENLTSAQADIFPVELGDKFHLYGMPIRSNRRVLGSWFVLLPGDTERSVKLAADLLILHYRAARAFLNSLKSSYYESLAAVLAQELEVTRNCTRVTQQWAGLADLLGMKERFSLVERSDGAASLWDELLDHDALTNEFMGTVARREQIEKLWGPFGSVLSSCAVVRAPKDRRHTQHRLLADITEALNRVAASRHSRELARAVLDSDRERALAHTLKSLHSSLGNLLRMAEAPGLDETQRRRALQLASVTTEYMSFVFSWRQFMKEGPGVEIRDEPVQFDLAAFLESVAIPIIAIYWGDAIRCADVEHIHRYVGDIKRRFVRGETRITRSDYELFLSSPEERARIIQSMNPDGNLTLEIVSATQVSLVAPGSKQGFYSLLLALDELVLNAFEKRDAGQTYQLVVAASKGRDVVVIADRVPDGSLERLFEQKTCGVEDFLQQEGRRDAFGLRTIELVCGTNGMQYRVARTTTWGFVRAITGGFGAGLFVLGEPDEREAE